MISCGCWSKSQFFLLLLLYSHSDCGCGWLDQTGHGIFAHLQWRLTAEKTKASWLYSLFCFHIRILIQGYLFLALLLVSSWAHLRTSWPHRCTVWMSELRAQCALLLRTINGVHVKLVFVFLRSTKFVKPKTTQSKLLCRAALMGDFLSGTAVGQTRTLCVSVMQRIRRN